MSLIIATKNRRFTLKADENICEELFDKYILQLICGDEEEAGLETKVCEDVNNQVLKVMSDEYPEQMPAVNHYPTSKYGGFLHIQCKHCGAAKTYCAKTPTDTFICGCGEYTEITDVKTLYANCECGKQAKYRTNTTEIMFDIPCVECGAPVPIAYNEKKGIYETVRG
ncbi:hypothetical protein M2454_003084 [Aequitasia blattaphilus]|uniref:Uncharacterized protein n=1 Tax=Aequitasia blattaphilus TaxID=2949332 RepID=A0ABT1ED24_9FIRM|nr:hypothetical protein [Aequitasia blattaphilus]MCP1103733.1 hypothetical protein [Aequitasia blattaphilus]MCR8616373.1 hypothetical protein [Aequitasia blattaphilus]